MKLLRYGEPGAERPGTVDASGRLRDLSGVVADINGEALSPAALQTLAAIDVESLPLVDGQPRLGPCVGGIGKFLCIGLNFADHAAESNLPIPEEPVLFTKATSAISGPNDPIVQPRGSTKLDWEVEFGLVIGSTARYVDESDALSHVAGWCLINDVSERAFQLERGGTWDKGKGCDSFGPIGPWLVTRDEIADIDALGMWLEVNGVRHQNGSTRDMIFRPAKLVSYVSQFITLYPGDVISTGTPAGVGMGLKPPMFLKPGDVVRLGIEGLGEQQQTVIAAD